MQPATSTIYDTAIRLRAAGISVIAIKTDGSKTPIGEWKQYQTERADEATLQRWFLSGELRGIGIACGSASENMEVLDFDQPGIYERWLELVAAAGLGDVERQMPLEATPKGGRHLAFRCSVVEGNQKLAMAADKRELIETRGQGGQIVIAPSPVQCHPLHKAYAMLRGDYAQTPEITPEQRSQFLNLARSLNEYVKTEPSYEPREAPTNGHASILLLPGDDFNARADWHDILTPHGWYYCFDSGDVSYWKRPGKTDVGTSATTGYCHDKAGNDALYVFSSNAYPFENESSYSKFRAYTLLNHNGDFKAAARELAGKGYGESLKPIAVHSNGHSAGTEPVRAVEVEQDIKEQIEAVLRSKAKPYQIGRAVGQLVVAHMQTRGTFYYRDDDENFQYFFDDETHTMKPLGVEARSEAWLKHAMTEHYGVLPTNPVYGHIWDSLCHHCRYQGQAVTLRQFSWYDEQNFVLYVYNNAGQVYKLNGVDIAVMNNGDDHVMFEELRYAPFEANLNYSEPLLDKLIYMVPNYSEDPDSLTVEQQRLLFALWTLAIFFDSMFASRVLLLLYGQSGGGKSAALRAVHYLFQGMDGHDLSTVPSNEDRYDDIVLANRMVCFDNADSYYRYLPDKLAVTATGYEVQKRELYTTAHIARFSVRCWVGLTSRDVTFNREDVTNRMLILKTVRRLDTKVAEGRMRAAVAQARNDLWGEILVMLNKVVVEMMNPYVYQGSFRMADFAQFGLTAARIWPGKAAEFSNALDRLSSAQNLLAMDGNPLFEMLTEWLEDDSKHGVFYTIRELYSQLTNLANNREGMKDDFLKYCPNASRLSRHLRTNRRAMEQFFVIEDKDDRHKNVKLFAFKPKERTEE